MVLLLLDNGSVYEHQTLHDFIGLARLPWPQARITHSSPMVAMATGNNYTF